MRSVITARRDYDAARFRGVRADDEERCPDRRLMGLAEIYDGGSRTKAACVGGGGLQTGLGAKLRRAAASREIGS
jgi:hypothetical protein